MAHVFVTGASGFIGSRLVWELIQRGHTVHALTRRRKLESPPGFLPHDVPDFSHPNLRLVFGDITDPESLRRGMAGCSHVYHLAGYAKNWARNIQPYFQNNIMGMGNVCKIAAELRVERVVWTSTMLTFGPTARGRIGDETMVHTAKCFTEYERSKAAAEGDAAVFVKDGLPLIIVNPGRVFGPGHLSEGNSVSLLIDMYDRGRVPFLLGGGRNVGNWVFVDDVVRGLILTMERGRIGEKYLLGGENISLKQFLQIVDQISGKRHFQMTIRRPGAMTYAWLLKQRARWFGRYPQITPDWVRLFLVDWAYSSAKAQHELGYTVTPLTEAVQKTYDWLLRVRSEKNNLSLVRS
jgi:nucleoside-diphosphate-sugar epimerase